MLSLKNSINFFQVRWSTTLEAKSLKTFFQNVQLNVNIAIELSNLLLNIQTLKINKNGFFK